MSGNAKINATAIKLINDTIGCIYDYCDNDEANARLVALGKIKGICALAKELTEEVTEDE